VRWSPVRELRGGSVRSLLDCKASDSGGSDSIAAGNSAVGKGTGGSVRNGRVAVNGVE
jgi:hypothetical protein